MSERGAPSTLPAAGSVPPEHAGASTPVALLLAVVFAGALLLGRETVPTGGNLALVSPASGVAAVWFGLRSGTRARALDVALLVTATTTVHLSTGSVPPLALVAGVAITVQTLLFVTLLRRWCPAAGPRRPLRGTRDLLRLLTATCLAVTASALLGPTTAWWHTGHVTWLDLPVWVTRNGLSVLLLSCAGLRLVGPAGTTAAPARRTVETVTLLAVTAVAYAVQFTTEGLLSLVFLLPVLTVWAGLRLDSRSVVWHCLLTGVAAVVPTLLGQGPFAAVPDPAARAFVVQAFAGVTTFTGLLLALGRDERDTLLQEVRRQAEDAHRQAHAAETLTIALRSLNVADDTRGALCEATARITGADGALLLEPDGRGNLTTRAAWGQGAGTVSVPAGSSSPLARAFRSGETVFAGDVTGTAWSAGQSLGADVAAVACQPVTTTRGRVAGLLVNVWREPVPELPARVRLALATFAQEAAHGVERADLLVQLALAAERDPLTGLANRRRWDEATALEIARAARTGLPLTFCLIDLDHFKRYNDTHGHLAGDDLLRDFAAAAAGCLREVDTLARWGGEEFVLALPGCSSAGARAVADRVRAAVPSAQTCTIGVAQWQPGLSAAEVVARADLALYEGKKAGRDVTVIAPATARVEPDEVPADDLVVTAH